MFARKCVEGEPISVCRTIAQMQLGGRRVQVVTGRTRIVDVTDSFDLCSVCVNDLISELVEVVSKNVQT